MFDRFIRLARARKALHDGRFVEAARLADDPLIRDDRRAVEVRDAVRTALRQRAAEREQAGDLGAAQLDLQEVLALGPDAEATARLQQLEQRLQSAAVDLEGARAGLVAARRRAEQGELAEAERLAAPAAAQPALAPLLQALRAFVDARRSSAAAHRDRARELLQQDRIEAALAEVRAARALDTAVGVPFLAELMDRAAAELDAGVGRLVDGDPAAAATAFRQRLAGLPELASAPAMQRLGDRIAAAIGRRLAAAADPGHEVELLVAAAAEPPLPLRGEALARGARLLQRLPALRTAGRTEELARALEQAGAQLELPALHGEAQAVRVAAGAAAARFAAVREQAAAGDLVAARAGLLEVLEVWPLHEEARAELAAVERGLRERGQRLDAAREAARQGRLREAYGLALAHALPGAAGEEGRALARDLQARIDLIGRGIDQVRAAAHGLESGSPDGLRHCVSRLDELAKLQSDHEELPVLRDALLVEVGAIERWESARRAIEERRLDEAADAMHEIVALRPRLLAAGRLDARLLALADLLVQAAEDALAAGRLAAVASCLRGLAAAAGLRSDLAAAVRRLEDGLAERKQRAEAMVAEARDLLAQRELAAAESRCEQARTLWVDGPHGRQLEEELRAVREQEAALSRVAALTDQGDVDSARAQLASLPPTPPLLRTRIFDLKQSLARAQGLEGGFLLRVDEGGEFLVLRGETVSIGNVREGRADLPILAAIAGRHARIERSMSFHGGMQDCIVAENGELRRGGARVDRHLLASGDRVQLGSTLQLQYVLPCSRSLSACLQLLGGFQVAGTDRVVLMKDRGRDGRLLLGPGKDVHVRVASATGEVEVFAHKTGQIRVRCDAGGTIDGRPFRGEHPLDAGALVQAAGIGFVLLPWRHR